MAKTSLSTAMSGYNLQVLNNNFSLVASELQNKVLYRNNPSGEPNQMENTLDMNSNKIINLAAPQNANDAARYGDIPFEPIPIGTTTALLTTLTPFSSVAATNVQAGLEEIVSDLATTNGAYSIGFAQLGSGSVSRTVGQKLRQYIHIRDFGGVGIGDETVALTNFFNSAIANPGVPHYLEKLTYQTTTALPTVNVSNVWIEGVGTSIHDVGSVFNGTVIKYIGVPGATMVSIRPDDGAANQRLCNIKFKGIGLDAGQLAAECINIKSIWESDIFVGTNEATSVGMKLGVVTTLGEGRDLQRNDIRLFCRQQFQVGAFGLSLVGDTIANVSLNNFWVEAQHTNVQAINCAGSDNNFWKFIRTAKFPSGTATEGMSLEGGASAALATRDEIIEHYVGTVPIHVYGTGGSIPYAFAATNINLFRLDKGNGTPDPIVESGASIYWNNSDVPFGNAPWILDTVTPIATVGTLGTSSCVRAYLKRGKIVHVAFTLAITTNGTGATAISLPLPYAEALGRGFVFTGIENNLTSKAVTGIVSGGSSNLICRFYDGTYPGANNHQITISGTYATL